MMKKLRISIISVFLITLLICTMCSISGESELRVDNSDLESVNIVNFVNNAPVENIGSVVDSKSVILPKNTRSNPSSVDLSTSAYFPPVKSQGSIGNCSSWAAVYYQFGFQVASKFMLNVSSNYNLFSPKWVHNIAKHGTGNGGSYYHDVYDVLSSNGAVRYSQVVPVTTTISESSLPNAYLSWYINESAMTNALKYRVSNVEYLKFADVNTVTPIASHSSTCLNNMKTFLNNGFVITFTTDFGKEIDDWQYRELTSQTVSSLNGENVCVLVKNMENSWNGHAMAIVGYNDNITYDLNGNGTIQSFERGAFKVVNSHGTDWQNGGFVWLMYDALNKVSNVSSLNVSNRKAALENYEYNVINVNEYSQDILVKVTLNHNNRTQVDLDLSATTQGVTESMNTMLLQKTNAEDVNFSGTGTTAQDATFVFDFGDLYGLDTPRSSCHINIKDEAGGNALTIKKVQLIDSTGKVLKNDTASRTVNGNEAKYNYSLGITGDINDDANVNVTDSSLIQKYLAQIITFDSYQMKVADVNGDGKVTTSDVSMIQKYSSHIIEEFTNGSFILFESSVN